MQPGRCRLPLQQNNQAALRDELRPERELCALRLPLLARALVVRARAVVVRLLLRPEVVERERAETRLPPEREEPDRAETRLPPERWERAEVERVPLDRREPAALERLPRGRFDRAELERVPVEREDLAREFPLLLDDELRELREAVERERASAERLRPLDSFSCTVSRLTSLLKRLLGSASYTN